MAIPIQSKAGLPPQLRELLGRLEEGTPVNAVAAQGVFELTGDASDGETVTIGDTVFEFNATGTVTDGNVTVDVSGGAGLTAAAAALASVIRATPACLVTAAAAGGLMTVDALTRGSAGNMAVTTDAANGSFSTATLEGGVDGTLAAKFDVRTDGSYLYVASAANGISDRNWRRVDLGSAY